MLQGSKPEAFASPVRSPELTIFAQSRKKNDRSIFDCQNPANPMRKGEQTRAAILDAALDIASKEGLEGLTIGVLAERIQMSKSGVFAHFGSREDLQIQVLKEYERRFVDAVLLPSLPEKRGLPRLEAIFMRWLEKVGMEIHSGCIYVSGASEYDDRPGPIRDELVRMLSAWEKELMRATRQAVEAGDLPAGLSAEQVVYEMFGLTLAAHQSGRLMHRPDAVVMAKKGFDRLVGRATAETRCSVV
jgi:AcrR family transcriptional regulator